MGITRDLPECKPRALQALVFHSGRLHWFPKMSEPVFNAIVLRECDLTAPQTADFVGGQVVLFTRRCPGRETVNEDAAAALTVSASAGVLVIADGVGGMKSGNHASAVAVDSLQTRLQQVQAPDTELRSAILDGFEQANARLCDVNAGAATTLVVMEVQGDRVRPYHVGDSMILLCGQRGTLRWQSISHSPVGYAVEAGVIDADDALNHPDRHVVSNVVGCPEMRIEIGPPLTMAPRDTLLMCSDGLSDNLTTDEIIEIVRCGELQAAVQELVERATARMQVPSLESQLPSKPDDLTVVAFRRTPPARR